MGFFDNIVQGAHALRADSGASSSGGAGVDLSSPRFWGEWGSSTAAGMRIDAESVKSIGAAQACIRYICNSVAPMPLKVYEATSTGKRLARECPEYALLYSRPNDRQTSFEFRQTMQGHFELHGNAYAQKVMDRFGATLQLLPWHPSRVTPEVLSNGRMRYKYQDPLSNSTKVYAQDQVFHLRNWSEDGYVGQSPLSLGRNVFGVAMAAQDYTARFFQNDSKPGLYFQQDSATAPRFKSEQDKEEFRENWRKSQTGANRHKIAFAPPGWVLKEFGINPVNAQLLEARKFSRIEVCSIYGVPPHVIDETEKAATYASVEQFQIMAVTQCLMPRCVLWEQAIQHQILQDDSFSARFSMAALLRGDNASRTAAYAVAVQNGWMSQNDVRMLEDLDPIEDGDTYWRPLAWAPLGQLASPDPATGSGNGKQRGDLESDDTKKAEIIHNTHILGAMAGKSLTDVLAVIPELK